MVRALQEYLLPMLHFTGRPEAWGIFHSLFFFIGIPTVIVLAFLLRKTSKGGEKRLFLSVGVALLLAEVFKQLACTAIEGAYRFDLIPFQLCSIPMYLCILIGMLPESAFTRTAKAFLSTFGLMGGIASYIAPGSMLNDCLELTLHSFLWHLCLIFLGFFVFFSMHTKISKRDFGNAVILYFSFCIIALTINILCFDAPGRDVNMFYIGPKPSHLPLCRDITERFGVAFNSIVYMLSLSLCACIIYIAEKYFIKLCENIFKAIDKE